jgi:hypothetical protein
LVVAPEAWDDAWGEDAWVVAPEAPDDPAGLDPAEDPGAWVDPEPPLLLLVLELELEELDDVTEVKMNPLAPLAPLHEMSACPFLLCSVQDWPMAPWKKSAMKTNVVFMFRSFYRRQ